jgi:hypothetical protein
LFAECRLVNPPGNVWLENRQRLLSLIKGDLRRGRPLPQAKASSFRPGYGCRHIAADLEARDLPTECPNTNVKKIRQPGADLEARIGGTLLSTLARMSAGRHDRDAVFHPCCTQVSREEADRGQYRNCPAAYNCPATARVLHSDRSPIRVIFLIDPTCDRPNAGAASD